MTSNFGLIQNLSESLLSRSLEKREIVGQHYIILPPILLRFLKVLTKGSDEEAAHERGLV